VKEHTILVVDDQKGIRFMIAEALQDIYNVYSASTGVEAIALMQKIKPDLILLDMKMPGMSGLEVNKEVAFLNLNIPIIMISAYSDLNLINKLKNQDIKHFLFKPFDIADLRTMVSNILKPKEERFHA
jgi:two-component system response regulator (stage 0 sporulation protein F)